MCKYLRQTKGITLVESIIAIFIVSIGLIGLLSMQPSAWKMTARTDYLGRGANVLYKELITHELNIMNPCNAVVASDTIRTVNSSGQDAAQAGDIQFTVRTIIAPIVNSNAWTVRVIISWPPLNTTGISETLVVTRQEHFRLGCL